MSIQEEHEQLVSAPGVFPNPCNSTASILFDGVENPGSIYILSGKTIVDEISNLDSVCLWYPRKRKAEQMQAVPTKIQGKILKAFGYEIEKGVLQNQSI